MTQKPSIPKGTRDFSPEEMAKRNYIFDIIKEVFAKYGFAPIETPAMENLSTLLGKYGEEGDKLIFKILNSGDFKKDIDISLDAKQISAKISEKALKYDLTVPFARYVVQHQNEISFPFKRYQIQPVWRADRPQKGRYREFYQCDADVIGSTSLLNEVELCQILDDVFTKLKLPVAIKINSRKILSGIAEFIGEKDNIVAITVAMDKLDKVGLEGVNKELQESGVSETAIAKLQPLIEFKGTGQEKIAFLKTLLASSKIGLQGVAEIEYVFSKFHATEPGKESLLTLNKAHLELDITLARGLSYYTGLIFEVKAEMGTLSSSICGGGRYDDLTGIFGLPNVSGVGISFGIDRIYYVLDEQNMFPEMRNASTQVLFIGLGDAEQDYSLPLIAKARHEGINAEIYPDASAKMKKKMSYADTKKIPFVIIIGSDEMQSGQLGLKNMKTGDQEQLNIDAIITKIKSFSEQS